MTDQTDANQIDAIEILRAYLHALNEKDQVFAKSLLDQFDAKEYLSDKQWPWVTKMAQKAVDIDSGIKNEALAVQVGSMEGLAALFAKAKKKKKYPTIFFQDIEGMSIRLSLTGDRSKHPNSISVTDGKPYGQNQFYGWVLIDGAWIEGRHVIDKNRHKLTRFLIKLSANPAKVAGEYGKLHCRCVFCNAQLSDDRSKHVGYGKTCASHFDLPWGKKDDDQMDWLKKEPVQSKFIWSGDDIVFGKETG